jgi:hypothetical protein
LLAHGGSLGACDCIVASDGPSSGLESRSHNQQCEPPPGSICRDPPHSFQAGPTLSVEHRAQALCSTSRQHFSKKEKVDLLKC